MTEIKKVLAWILTSSANPNEVSLTIKGIASFIVPIVIALSGATHLNLGTDQLNAIVDSIIQFVQAVLLVVSTAVTTYGLVRKLFWPATPPTV